MSAAVVLSLMVLFGVWDTLTDRGLLCLKGTYSNVYFLFFLSPLQIYIISQYIF